jgi:uncharacterized protein with ATP-grasp and redox domains
MVSDDEAVAERVLRRVLEGTNYMRMDLPPPYMGRQIHRIIREVTRSADPYVEIKRKSTKTALSLYERVVNAVERHADPFEAAVRFSIAGNVMDYALTSTWDLDRIYDCFDDALSIPIDEEAMRMFRDKAVGASNILFIGDNAGETVFDRILVEQLPVGSVTYAVKGSPIINDATRQDAEAAGLNGVARIVDNGSDAPGTILELCSQDFCDVFDSAELVLAKGQANIETLHRCHRDVFFLTQVKCPVIARGLNADVGDWLVEYWQPDGLATQTTSASESEVPQ